MALLHRMAWFFIGFEAHQYLQSVLLNELHMRYLHVNNVPVYTDMVNNIRTHNEERGEMSLSLLAFSVLGDTDKSTFEKLDTNYTILNYCRNLVKGYVENFGIKPPTDHSLNISRSTTEINCLTKKMHAIISSMSDESWTSIQYRDGVPFTSAAPRERLSHLRFLSRSPSHEIRAELSKLHDLLLTNNFSFPNTDSETVPLRPLTEEEIAALVNE